MAHIDAHRANTQSQHPLASQGLVEPVSSTQRTSCPTKGESAARIEAGSLALTPRQTIFPASSIKQICVVLSDTSKPA